MAILQAWDNMLLNKLNNDMRSHGGGCRRGGLEIDLKQKKSTVLDYIVYMFTKSPKLEIQPRICV